MTPVEEALHGEVLLSLTGNSPPSPSMEALFSVTAHLGGLGMRNPSGTSTIHHQDVGAGDQTNLAGNSEPISRRRREPGSPTRGPDRSAPGDHQGEEAQGRRAEGSALRHQ